MRNKVELLRQRSERVIKQNEQSMKGREVLHVTDVEVIRTTSYSTSL